MSEGRLKAGEVFHAYTIRGIVGVGGISEVYAAEHNFLGHTSAMKVLQLRHVANGRIVELARAEAIALSRIRHANLVQVVDAGITPRGEVWMCMPLLEGATLRDYLFKKPRPPILDVLRFARDIADGTRAAHEVGIFHRDLKPENVFITTRLETIVLDLGMAKFLDYGLQSTGEGRAVGTVRYMSPEHASGSKVDGRTDIWAIGVMMYEMFAGEHPFHRGEDGDPLPNLQVGLAIMTREPKPLTEVIPGFPQDVWELVRKAMAKNREDRHPTMQELAGAIRTVRKRIAGELAEAPEKFGPQEAPVASEPGTEHAYVPPPGRGADAGPIAAQAVATHHPTQPAAQRMEATPPPSASDRLSRERAPASSSRVLPILGALGVAAALTVTLQLVIRGSPRGPASTSSAAITATTPAPEPPTSAASTPPTPAAELASAAASAAPPAVPAATPPTPQKPDPKAIASASALSTTPNSQRPVAGPARPPPKAEPRVLVEEKPRF